MSLCSGLSLFYPISQALSVPKSWLSDNTDVNLMLEIDRSSEQGNRF